MATTQESDVREIAMSWLKGESGAAAGPRVLFLTYNNAAYLGALEDHGQYVQRFHVERGRLCESSLKGSQNEEEEAFISSCARLIPDLQKAGIIKSRQCPRQYMGAGALFELA